MKSLNSSLEKRIFIFALFSISFFRFSLYGQFFLVEVLLFLYFLSFLVSKMYKGRSSLMDTSTVESLKYRKVIVRFFLLLLVSSLVNGFIFEASFTDQIKGFALIFFTLSNFLGITQLTKLNLDLLVSAFCGLAVSGILGFFFQPNDYAKSEVWKFGFSYSLSYLVILFLIQKNRFKFLRYQYFLLAFGFFAIAMGTRSLGSCIVVTGGVILYASRTPKKTSSDMQRVGFNRLLAVAIIVAIFATLINSFYGIAAKEGYFGEKSKGEYLIQSRGDYGPIVGGRVEPFIALVAILNSPILGYGYGADSTVQIYEKADNFFQLHNYDINLADIQRKNEGNIPQHSYLLNFWISYGICGLFFWMYFLKTNFRLVITEIYLARPIMPLFVFVSVLTGWNIFFSPYGAGVRIEFALILSLTEAVISSRRIKVAQ